jgi:hypothetical protein
MGTGGWLMYEAYKGASVSTITTKITNLRATAAGTPTTASSTTSTATVPVNVDANTLDGPVAPTGTGTYLKT